jgi:CRP-like cAMP-binding protein
MPFGSDAQQAFIEFVESFPQESFLKNTVFIKAEEVAPAFFYLEKGCVKMSTVSQKGQNLTLHIYYPGACFPLLSLVSTQETAAYDFESLTPVTIRRISRESFQEFLKTHNEVCYEFLLRMTKGTQGLLRKIEQTAALSARQQVASLLLYFTRHFQEKLGGADTIQLPLKLTHQDIADWLGLTRENTSLQMKKLEKEGFVKKEEGQVVVMNVEGLRKLVEPETSPLI